MGAPYRIDAWTTFSPVMDLAKTRQQITIDGFSEHCVESDNACLDVAYNGYTYYDASANTAFKDIFTLGPVQVDCWVKPSGLVSGQQEICYVFGRGWNDTTPIKAQWQIKIEKTNAVSVLVTENTGTQYTYTTAAKVLRNQWNHVGYQWDDNGIMYIFVNGVKEQFDSVPATLGATGDNAFVIGRFPSGTSLDPTPAAFCVDEIRVWDTWRGDEYFKGNVPRFKRSAVTETTLKAYWKFNGSMAAESTGYVMGSATNVSYGDEGYPNLLSSYSFPVANVSLAGVGKRFSLVFPYSESVDGYSLVLRWTDSDGVVQKRLYARGSDFSPAYDIPDYKGETLEYATAYLEFWNDISSTVVTVPDTILTTSIKHVQTSLHGGEPSDTITPTVDNALWATIGSLPMNFNSVNNDN